MKLSDFYFDLPQDRIARFPTAHREESRLMVVEKKTGKISHHIFKDIVGLTSEKDFFVMNNTGVMPVKLFGRIEGKPVEMVMVEFNRNDLNSTTEAEVLTLPAKKFKRGQRIIIEDGKNLWAEVLQLGYKGRRLLRFNQPLSNVLKAGYAPLPPYIKRKFDEARLYKASDLEHYQTVYSRIPGSVAAPTAGLHFSREILYELGKRGEMIEITLNVGEATFQKIEADDIAHHRMGKETITISYEQRNKIMELKKKKNLVAVGTTSVRSLESLAFLHPKEEAFETQLFIYPPFHFRMVDKLITNFHLPESSLFILVSAFAGIELMKEAYRIAIEKGYRFFSYGDAMAII